MVGRRSCHKDVQNLAGQNLLILLVLLSFVMLSEAWMPLTVFQAGYFNLALP